MKDNVFKIFFIFCLLFSINAKALTYEQALDLAIGYDKKYASAILEQKSSEYLSTIARSGLIAKMQLTGFQAANRLNNNQPDIFGNPGTTNLNYTSQNYTASLTQPLLNLAALAEYMQSGKQEEAAVAKLSIAFNELSLQVASAYSSFGAAKEALYYTKKELSVLEDQEKITLAKKKAGLSSQTDLEEVIYSKLQVQANLDDANNTLASAIITLEKLIGIKVPPNELVAFIPNKNLLGRTLDDLIFAAKQDNPKILYQKKQYESSVYEHRKARAGWAPTLDLVAQQSYQNSGTLSTINQKSLQTYTGLQLNIPIFNGGATYGRDRQTAINSESQRVLIESETNDVEESIKKDYESMRTANDRYKTLKSQVESAKYLFGSTEKQKEMGLKSTYDLLISIRRLFQSERESSRTKYDGALAGKKLEINSGLNKY